MRFIFGVSLLVLFIGCGSSSDGDKTTTTTGKTKSQVVASAPPGDWLKLPNAISGLTFGMSRWEARQNSAGFHEVDSADCNDEDGIYCGFTIESGSTGITELDVSAEEDAKLQAHIKKWPAPTGVGADGNRFWLVPSKNWRVVYGKGRYGGSRIRYHNYRQLKDILGNAQNPLQISLKLPPVHTLDKKSLKKHYGVQIRNWGKNEVNKLKTLKATMPKLLASSSSKRPSITLKLPTTQLSNTPIYLRPTFGKKERITSYEAAIPYDDTKAGPKAIKAAMDQKFGPAVTAQGADGSTIYVYGTGVQTYAWNDAAHKAYHLRVANTAGTEAFTGWGKGLCHGMGGYWRGKFWGGSLSGAHYLKGRIYPKADGCEARFTITFARGRGAVYERFAVTKHKDGIKIRGLSFTQSRNRRRRGYSKDTFIVKSSGTPLQVNGNIYDASRRRGKVRLERR